MLRNLVAPSVTVFTLLTSSLRLVIMLTIAMLVLNQDSFFYVKLLLVKNNKLKLMITIKSMSTLITNSWRVSIASSLLVNNVLMKRKISSYLMVLLFQLVLSSISMKLWNRNLLLQRVLRVLLLRRPLRRKVKKLQKVLELLLLLEWWALVRHLEKHSLLWLQENQHLLLLLLLLV